VARVKRHKRVQISLRVYYDATVGLKEKVTISWGRNRRQGTAGHLNAGTLSLQNSRNQISSNLERMKWRAEGVRLQIGDAQINTPLNETHVNAGG
jgi:hypothetical protein